MQLKTVHSFGESYKQKHIQQEKEIFVLFHNPTLEV